jgi:hypothetical protein
MSKSYVTMESKICLVCGKNVPTGTLFLDKRLKERFEQYTATGFDLCDEHKKQIEEGYVFLVGCDMSRTEIETNGTSKPENWYRTGKILGIRKKVAKQIFNIPITKSDVFPCDDEAIDKIMEMCKNNKGDTDG